MALPALTIDIGAKKDKYDRTLKDIGDQADATVSKIESKFASFDPELNLDNYNRSLTSMVEAAGKFAARIGGVGLAAGIAGAGIAALIDLTVNLNKSLSDMAETADRVGVTYERFQQLKFGANAIGLSDSDFTSSLDGFAKKLQDASFQANDLTRVFQANGVSIRDANGQLKDTGTLLNNAFDIIKRAPKIQDAIQIGSFLGISSQFSQSIKEGGDEFLNLANKANAAGAVVSRETIDKAQEFTRQWNIASTQWGVGLRAAIGDILPLLNQAVAGAVAVINSVSSIYKFLSNIKNLAIAPDVSKADLGTLQNYIQDLKDVRSALATQGPRQPSLISGLATGGASAPTEPQLSANQALVAARVPHAGASANIQDIDAEIAKINDLIATRKKAQGQKDEDDKKNASNNPGPKIAAATSDQFSNNVDQLTKRTAQINADTIAVTQNNAVRAQLRAEFQLLNAIVRDGGEVTQAQIDQYEKLRVSMGAQEALTAAGITLNQEHAASFLTVSQNIGTATKNFDGARDSLNKVNSASQQLGSALSTAFSDAVVDGKNLNDVVSSLLKTLEKAALNSVFASIFNAPTGGGLSPFAAGLGSLLGIGRNAGGTDNWRGGPTWVGENGPEIANLPAGSQVTPADVSRRVSGGSTFAPSYVINAQGADSGTVERIYSVLRAHDRQIASTNKSISSAQRMQATGVA